MNTPALFCKWMCEHIANDHKFGRKVFRYHPRSDEHSKVLCRLVLDDIIAACPTLAQQALARLVVGGPNVKFKFANGKEKTVDLGVGTPRGEVNAPDLLTPIVAGPVSELRIACEAKQCMTEHGKTEPRIFDELSSSHEIVHQGDTKAIAAGIVVVNIADNYASPTRQTTKRGPLVLTKHRQPHVTAGMVEHLRGLKLRDEPGQVGFDAIAIIVINCDNCGPCSLHTDSPAPQPGDRDHYSTFIERISRAYSARYGG